MLPDRVIEGVYNGYGRVSGVNLMDKKLIPTIWTEGEDGHFTKEVKMYHTVCYNEIGRPIYEEARFSKTAEDQGFFLHTNDKGDL